MRTTLDIFHANLHRVRSIHGIYLTIVGQVTSIVDLSDLLRAEIVLIVSALDHFVHELTCAGMMEIWQGTRPPTAGYRKFSVSLNLITQLSSGVRTNEPLDSEIRARHSFQTFQQPDSIAEALRLFSAVELWNEVGVLIHEDPKILKARLKLIVERRNKIAHEADIDPSYPGQRWPIGPNDAEDACEFIKRLGEAIYNVVG